MDRALAAREYAGHLTDADLTLLALAGPGAGPGGGPGDGSWLRGDPAALLRLLEDPGTFGTVLGGGLGEGPGEGSRGWAVQASPFLIFALLVQRATTELASAAHVPERTGLRQRVPLFDAPALRDFLADGAAAVPGRAAGLLHPGAQRPVPGPGGRPDPDPAVQRARPGAARGPA
jgi:hypothetical protein